MASFKCATDRVVIGGFSNEIEPPDDAPSELSLPGSLTENAGTIYVRWRQAAKALTAHLGAQERDQVFGGTAIGFYRLVV